MQTTIQSGIIKCALHGSITAIDCDTLQNKSCNGCFIYNALKDMSTDTSEFNIPNTLNFKDICKSIN